ncbi:9142_t:CDS:2 [Entrophospora sp. SA101]|nr:9298_t:CDS:2 [Entrophospora sp. SA101]CAJ0840734.1 786_t:CDS:2 [Entrophospora sp. SA101]CAJ0905898.1 9142_t:CDS:2 [Entrophospora sp. SA101]
MFNSSTCLTLRKYLQLLKKNRRQLKKEARQKNRFGNEKLVRIPSRQNLENPSNLLIIDEQTKSLTDDDKNNHKDVSIYTKKKNDLSQRITSAIRKSNEEVPHMYMSNSFVKIDDIIVSDNLKTAKIWWRPLIQDDVSGPEIERCFQSYRNKYSSILKRYMRLKKAPKLIFMRNDLANDGILNVLENLEIEMKLKQQQQQQEKNDDKNLIGTN